MSKNGVPPQKILIIRLSAIGDILLATPVIRALRTHFPHARLDFVVKASFAEVLRYHPAIDQLYELPANAGWPELRTLGRRLREVGYDVVFDMHKNFRSRYLTLAAKAQQILRHRKHVLRRWILVKTKINMMRNVPPIARRYLSAAVPLGIVETSPSSGDNRLELFWGEQEEREAESALLAHGWQSHLPLVGLAPGAGYFTKRWPPEYFGQLAAQLSPLGNQIVLLGGPQDTGLGEVIEKTIEESEAKTQQQNALLKSDNARKWQIPINLIGAVSLLASAAVIKRCRLVIANDSGLMHVAEAVGTPVVAIFGSTVRELGFSPQNATSRVVETRGLSCRPCSHLGYAQCPQKHFRCMREILPSEVLMSALEKLSPVRGV